MSSNTAFSGKFIDVVLGRYRRQDGVEVDRQVVQHPGAVAIVAYDDEFIHLVRQPREPVGEDSLLELPAGTLDVPGESELECAKRELSEEVGLAAEEWRLLRTIYTTPGYSNERCTIFAASGLSESPGEEDEDEAIEVVRVPLRELEGVVAQVQDAKTLIGLLMLMRSSMSR